MRVTQRSLQDSWIQNIQTRLTSLETLNRQIGSGKRLERAADDPSGANRIVRIEDVVARNEQYLRNIEEAVSVQRMAESSLDQVYQRVVRAKSLAVEGASDGSDPSSGSLRAMSEEVEGIISGVLQLAAGKYRGDYLFSGTAGETPPYAESGDWRYRGDSNYLRVNMGNGQTVAVNTPGDMVFREMEARSFEPLEEGVTLDEDLEFRVSDGKTERTVALAAGSTYATPQDLADAVNAQLGAEINIEARVNSDQTFSLGIADTLGGGELSLTAVSGDLEGTLGITPGTKNVFSMLEDLKAAFDSQDSREVAKQLGRLDRALGEISSQRGQLGSRMRNLEFARDRLENYNVTSQTLREEIEGVDLAESVMRLSAEEQAYQTSLAAGARIFNVSILDYLR